MPELVFPNAKINKALILNHLPAPLLQHVTWCEYGEPDDMKFCEKCPACLRAEGHRVKYERVTGTRHKTRKERAKEERMAASEVPLKSESESLTET